MADTTQMTSGTGRFRWLERDHDDFPFYRGRPVAISTGGWIVVLGAVVIGFLVLTQGSRLVSGVPARFLIAFLYAAIPLAALAIVAGRSWTALFRRLRGSDFLWMIAFAVLNLIVTLLVGMIMIRLVDTTANEAIANVASANVADRLVFFSLSAIQLVGEEVMSILPFLALLFWLTAAGIGRKGAIVVATLVVAVLFAAAHLPTYDWNVVQALMGVGVARIVLLLPYMMTKNLAVSVGAHILNDWMFFGVSILGAAAGAAA